MKSVIDEALETNHQKYDEYDPKPESEESEEETFPLMKISKPIQRGEDDVEDANVKQNTVNDYDHAREVAHNLLEQQQEMIKSMANFLNACPSARAYEVMNQMMKTAMDMSKDLMELPKQLKEAQAEAAASSGGSGKSGDTFIFSGGPTEIIEKLNKAAEAEKKVIDKTPDE